MKKIYQIYNQIERMILGLILIVLIVMGFVSVICRFVLQVPLAWAEEFMLFCMVWIAYLGASAAANERKHVRVGLFVGFMPKPVQKVSDCRYPVDDLRPVLNLSGVRRHFGVYRT